MKLEELFEQDYNIEDKYQVGSIKELCGDRVDFNSISTGIDKIFKFKKVSSLEGCPDQLEMLSISGDKNLLTNLKGMPKVITERCFLTDGKQLDSFEGAEGVSVKSLLSFTGCRFTSLHNIHKAFSSVNRLSFISNPVESHVLGLLKIKNLNKVVLDNAHVQGILNKYLPMGDLLACQQELMDAGYEDFAQL